MTEENIPYRADATDDQQLHGMAQERDYRASQQGSELFNLAAKLGQMHIDATRAAMDADPVPMMGLHGYSFPSLKEVVEHLSLEDFSDGELNQMNVLALRMQATVRSRKAARRALEKAKCPDEPVKPIDPTFNPYYANGRDSAGRYMGD